MSYSTILAQGHVKARKPHRCSLCGEEIEKGETHRVSVSVHEGRICRTRYHAECDKVPKIDKWSWIDLECMDEIEFRQRREELRAEGKL